MPCCPIEVGEFEESEAVPYHTTNDGEQAGKTVRPLTSESDEAKQHIKQHGRPKLPVDGMLGVAEEVADFDGLLDLIKEGFDPPPASIQITDDGGGPIKVVSEENHGDPFAVDLDPSLDSAEALRILPAGLVSDQSDLVVTNDITFGSFQLFPADVVAEFVLGPGDPEDAAFGQIEEVGKVNVGLVEHSDLSGLKPGAELHGAGVVMMGSFFNNNSEGRKKSLQVQAQIHLSGGLSVAVLGPVHAVDHQSDSRRVDRMDRPFEAAGQTTVTSGWTKAGVQRLEVLENTPKQLFHHVAVAVLVGVRERIAAWCDRAPDRAKLGSVVAQAVANIVQPNRVGQLRKQKTDHMAPRGEGAGLFVHAMLVRKFFSQVRRNELTKLMQCAAVVLGRRNGFHAAGPLVGIRHRPPLLSELKQDSQLHPVG